jgi:hypothetical protein
MAFLENHGTEFLSVASLFLGRRSRGLTGQRKALDALIYSK